MKQEFDFPMIMNEEIGKNLGFYKWYRKLPSIWATVVSILEVVSFILTWVYTGFGIAMLELLGGVAFIVFTWFIWKCVISKEILKIELLKANNIQLKEINSKIKESSEEISE